MSQSRTLRMAALAAAAVGLVAGQAWLSSPSHAQSPGAAPIPPPPPPGPFIYSVKFLCGLQFPVSFPPPFEPSVKPGNYATAVNIHNFRDAIVTIKKKAVVARPQGEPEGQVSNFFTDTLRPNRALEVDCTHIVQMVGPTATFLKGFVEIQSPVELSVVAVYTAQTCRTFGSATCTEFGELDLEVVPQRAFFLGNPGGVPD